MTRSCAKNSVLIVLPYAPTKIRPRARSNVTRLASMGYSVTVICPAGLHERDLVFSEFESSVSFVFVPVESFMRRWVRLSVGLLLLRPFSYYFYFSADLEREISRQLRVKDWASVFFERVPYLSCGSQGAIFDQTDCFSFQVNILRNLRSPVGLGYWIDSLLLPRFERKLASIFRAILVTTPLEAERARLFAGHRYKHKIESCLHDLQFGSKFSSDVPALGGEGGARIGFHGKLTYEPNRRALLRLEQLLGAVTGAGFELVVCGAGASEAAKVAPRLKYVGYVDDLAAHLRGLFAGLFPIKECVGVQNKVLECLSVGVPVIVSRQIFDSLEGIDFLVGRMIFIIDLDSFCWADRVVQIISHEIDPACGDRKEAIDYVARIAQEGRSRFEALVGNTIRIDNE